MGFMNRYAAIDKIEVTDLADPDGNDYWVRVRRLTGKEWEEADAAQTKVRAQMTQSPQANGKKARAELERRRAGRAAGPQDEAALQTMIEINTGAYREVVLGYTVVEWNLTDQFERPLLLAPAEAREQSIGILPDEMRTRIVEHAEANRQTVRDADEDADFRGEVPGGGQDGEIGSPADSGTVDEGGVVLAHWADDRAGVGDLHAA